MEKEFEKRAQARFYVNSLEEPFFSSVKNKCGFSAVAKLVPNCNKSLITSTVFVFRGRNLFFRSGFAKPVINRRIVKWDGGFLTIEARRGRLDCRLLQRC